ncbi:MAG: hypothetical protein HY805_02660 [Nitrospirae bacterium]|nr:hypothetical protein [Nitrospirota bacterium]
MEDVILRYAETKSLNFNESHIASFIADGLTVKGGMFLRKVKAKGEVRLLGANIGGNLECIGAVFENPKGTAFTAENLIVKGALFLNYKRLDGAGLIRKD